MHFLINQSTLQLIQRIQCSIYVCVICLRHWFSLFDFSLISISTLSLSVSLSHSRLPKRSSSENTTIYLSIPFALQTIVFQYNRVPGCIQWIARVWHICVWFWYQCDCTFSSNGNVNALPIQISSIRNNLQRNFHPLHCDNTLGWWWWWWFLSLPAVCPACSTWDSTALSDIGMHTSYEWMCADDDLIRCYFWNRSIFIHYALVCAATLWERTCAICIDSHLPMPCTHKVIPWIVQIQKPKIIWIYLLPLSIDKLGDFIELCKCVRRRRRHCPMNVCDVHGGGVISNLRWAWLSPSRMSIASVAASSQLGNSVALRQ